MSRSRSAQASTTDALARRLRFARPKRHREWWGLPNLTVLTLTTSAVRAAHLVDHVGRAGSYSERFAFAAEPSFGANWRVPRDLLAHLLHAPWKTAFGDKHIGRA